MKRLFDIVTSLFGLLILWPLFIVIAILIKIYMPGPVFFLQKRAGRYGNPFTIIKFRSMHINSKGTTVSVKGDSRITPLGRFLRKYKIDELPELINVLIGDMSLVGPRPDVPGYADKLEGEERKILGLRPGITGIASLKFINEEELLSTVPDPIWYNDNVIWPEKVRLNLDYYYNRSFFGDISIIFKTIF